MASKSTRNAEGVKLVNPNDIYSTVLPKHLRRRTVHGTCFSISSASELGAQNLISRNPTSLSESGHSSSSNVNNPSRSRSSSQPTPVSSIARGTVQREDKRQTDDTVSSGNPTKHETKLDNASASNRRHSSCMAKYSDPPTAGLTSVRDDRLGAQIKEDAGTKIRHDSLGIVSEADETGPTLSSEDRRTTKVPPRKPLRRSFSKEEWCPISFADPKTHVGSPGEQHRLKRPISKEECCPISFADPKTHVGSPGEQHRLKMPISKEEWCPISFADPKTHVGSPGEQHRLQMPGSRQLQKPLARSRENLMRLEEGVAVICASPKRDVRKVREVCREDVVRGYVCLSQTTPLLGKSHEGHTSLLSEAVPAPKENYEQFGLDKSRSKGTVTNANGNGSNAVKSISNPTYAPTGVNSEVLALGNAPDGSSGRNERKKSTDKDDLTVSSSGTDHAESPAHSSHSNQTADAATGDVDSGGCKRKVVNESPCSDDADSVPREHIVCSDDSLTVLQTCAVCMQSCSDLRLLLCFHIVCPTCVLLGCSDNAGRQGVVCAVCQSEQVLPPDGLTPLADIYPGLFTENTCSLSSSACSATSVQLSDEPGNITVSASDNLPDSASNNQCTNQAETLPSKLDSQSLRASSNHRDAGPARSKDDDSSEIQPMADVSENQGAPSAGETKTQLCGACQTRTATCHTCVTCGGVLLCEGCRVAHLNLPVTRSHEIVPVTSAPVSPLVLFTRRQPTCFVHGQDLSLTCTTCGVFLCYRCLVPDHTRHEIKELASMHHAKRKPLTTLQRTIKQHLLAARSAQRSVEDRLAKVETTRHALCTAIQTTAQHHTERIASQANHLVQDIEQRTAQRRDTLKECLSGIIRSQSEGQNLRCVLGALTDQTPHLTSLTLLHSCQSRYDALRNQAPLTVEEFEDIVFCKGTRLDAVLEGDTSLGSVRTVASGVSNMVMKVVKTFKVCADLSDLAVTPYGEVVCISAEHGTCQVWDCLGGMLLDASRHVRRPIAVQVMTNGVVVLLDEDVSPCDVESHTGYPPQSATHVSGGSRRVSNVVKVDNCCLKVLSPVGAMLSTIPLSAHADSTWIHCPDDRTILVSDELKKTVTLHSIDIANNALRLLRVVTDHSLLRAPRHVTANITGEWVASDGGSNLRVISPVGDVTTLLCSDKFEALQQPPRRGLQDASRMLGHVCCDSQGRVIAADVGICGVNVITGGDASNRERHFVHLRNLLRSAKMAAMCVDAQDRIYVGMSDGTVSILQIGPGGSVE